MGLSKKRLEEIMDEEDEQLDSITQSWSNDEADEEEADEES